MPFSITIATRADLFPLVHGGAVKIVRTAEGLSRNGCEVTVVTGDRLRYHRFVDGRHELLDYPPRFVAATRVHPRIRPLLDRLGVPDYWRTIEALLDSLGYPKDEHLLYRPLIDPDFWIRTIFVGLKHKTDWFQAEFPGFGVPCWVAARLLRRRCSVVLHNVEWKRLADTTDLSEATVQRLREIELQVCHLADEVIMSKHRKAWLEFRDLQDGEIIGHMARIARGLGRTYITYSWASNMGWWKACRDKIDAAFSGIPGNSVADSYYQNSLDQYADTFRKEVGLKRAMGQRFVFFRGLTKGGWKATVLSDDGFVHPKTWKTQVLRVVAALHGGVDLQNSTEFCGGIRYYLGEATRIIATFEPLFWDGERCDDLAASKQVAYPNLLVLRHKDERLVLLFNEDAKPLDVALDNKGLPAGATAAVYGTAITTDKPQRMTLTVPAEDVAVVHIRGAK